jgi:predicted RNA-binding Zn-ribbon protein involved in translation (DUF1610 family)
MSDKPTVFLCPDCGSVVWAPVCDCQTDEEDY